MKYIWFILPIIAFFPLLTFAQKKYRPSIERCDCAFRVDSSYIQRAPARLKSQDKLQLNIDTAFKKECGYLIVPENRKNAGSRFIKLPFIILKSKNTWSKKDPLLFTSGGPGNSSLGWINGISRSLIVEERDCIAFEQRGTRFAIPYLRFFDLDSSIKKAYRENLPKDSMWIEGVKKYKQSLLRAGVDIAGYNSEETVADISDLLSVLKIDSVNLLGGSYSGGLMMAVLQKNPGKVRSMILDSPLPMFTPIDEDEPVNFIEGLHILFQHVENDSLDKTKYAGLEQKFHAYFRSITNKTFYLPYYDSIQRKQLNIEYGKNDLLEIVVNDMLNAGALKELPHKITELISGNHAQYLRPRLDRILHGYPAPDGMRMLVYCADQAAYQSGERIRQMYALYPFLEGFRINDVWKDVCDCWKNPPISKKMKEPFYSSVPVLIGDGEMDPACRPLYMKEIRHYFPNAQSFLFINRSHGVGGKEFHEMITKFINRPFDKIIPQSKEVIEY